VEISELRGNDGQAQGQGLFSSGSSSLNRQGKAALDAWRTPSRLQARSGGGRYTTTFRQRQVGYRTTGLSTARAVNVVRYLQTKGVSRRCSARRGSPSTARSFPTTRPQPEPEPPDRDRPHRRRLHASVVDARSRGSRESACRCLAVERVIAPVLAPRFGSWPMAAGVRCRSSRSRSAGVEPQLHQ